MSYQFFYIRTVLLLLIIVFFSAWGVWNYYNLESIGIYIACGIAISWGTYQVLSSFKTLSSRISYFFNAVENDDSSLHFTENRKIGSFKELNEGLNRINNLIKETKLKNREQEQYYSALLEKIATGIVVLNEQGHILQANTAAKSLLNYSTLTHITQLKRVDEKLYQAFSLMKGENGSRQLVKLIQEDSVTQLSLQATTFSSIHGNFTLISVQDIRSELDAKELESWLKLVRVLTHEIMNSITPITSLSETLMEYYTDDSVEIGEDTIANTIKGLEVIKERGLGLIHFVESYRKLTKIPAPVFDCINVKSLFDKIVLLLKNDTEFNAVALDISIEPEDLSIRADEVQIAQVLINLVKNAIQAVVDVEHPKIKLVAVKRINGNCEISITDNGRGISEEIMEQIFIPFFTTKEKGSGIGLSLSRQIMRNHGGNIKVFSEPNKSTKFTLEF